MASVSTTAPTAASPPAARIPIKSRPLRPKPEPEPRIQILKDDTIASIADVITGGIAKNIIVMTGAGISTAAGIKDFRSPGTGLYDDLEKYNLPFPEAVFDLAFFKETPRPFYHLAKHLYPGQYRPTLTHYLLPLLAKKKLLLRSYTQNIDSLERLAGLDEDLLVEAHGSFASSKCVQCEMTSDSAWVKRHIMDGEIPYCKRCSGLVKPSITFFGENVPLRFTTMAETDFEKCDLLIVLGTSLKVEPFNKLIAKVSPKCPRLLINREKAGQELHSGFDFEDKWRYTVQRDAVFLGNCDDGVRKLAELCGWEDELQSMYDTGHEQLRLMQEQDELKSEDTQKSDDDEEDDCEKDDVDNDDGSENKSCPDTLDSSSSSLDDITYRFGRSTLQSQSDDSSISSEVGTSSSSEKDGDVHLKLKSTVADTLVPRTETDSPILQGAKSSTSESTQKDTSSKDALKSVSQVQDPNKDGAPDRMFSSKQALSQKRASTIPATQSVTNQRSHPSQSAISKEQAKSVSSETTPSSLLENAHGALVDSKDNVEQRLDFTAEVRSCKPVKTLSASPPGSPSTKRIISSAPSSPVKLSETIPSPLAALSAAKKKPSVTPPVYAISPLATSPTAAKLPLPASGMVALTDNASSTASMTSLGSSNPSTYTHLTIAAATPRSQQPFPTCVPATEVCANPVPDSSTEHSDADTHGISSDQPRNNASSSSSGKKGTGNGSSGHPDGSTCSEREGGGGGIGAGSLQLMRRKRRKDFEGAVHCAGTMVMPDVRFSYLRGPSTWVLPHHLACGRVTKRRRFV